MTNTQQFDAKQFDVTAETKDLTKTLGFAGSIVEKRNILPILSHIKLEAYDNKLLITATDMDLALCQNIGANIKLEGAVTVHSQTFSDIIRKINDKTLSLRHKEDTSQLEIHAQNCEVTLSTLPASEFPTMDDFTTKYEFTAPAKTIVELIEYTKFAISTEETRYNLNGIYLHSVTQDDGKKYLASAATDGHRLSTYTSKITLQEEVGIILPRKTIGELHKILKDPQMITKDVTISIGHNRVRFSCGNLVIVSKLIDGSFPDYQVFIPASNNNKLTIPSRLLTEVVDRVATVTADKFPAIKMTIMEDQVELNAHGEAKGLAHEIIPVSKEVQYVGNQITIGFNPRYILDVLQTLGEDEITFLFSDGFSPALIKSTNHPEANFVVMPVKV